MMRKSLLIPALVSAIVAGLASSASASPFVPRFEFNCGSAGTFFSEVNPLPGVAAPTVAPPDAVAGIAGSAQVRLLTTESGETNAVFVLLQVTGSFTNPGLQANQSNPNLATCIITRPDGTQFEAIGLLTPAG
jgi:hypothetical protein